MPQNNHLRPLKLQFLAQKWPFLTQKDQFWPEKTIFDPKLAYFDMKHFPKMLVGNRILFLYVKCQHLWMISFIMGEDWISSTFIGQTCMVKRLFLDKSLWSQDLTTLYTCIVQFCTLLYTTITSLSTCGENIVYLWGELLSLCTATSCEPDLWGYIVNK